MVRKSLAVIAGFVVWTTLWLGGNALILPKVQMEPSQVAKPLDTQHLTILLGLSVACSLIGGATTGRIVRGCSAWLSAPLVLAVALLLVGIAVEISVWDSIPAWYHLCFLGLLLPMTLAGARAGKGRSALHLSV